MKSSKNKERPRIKPPEIRPRPAAAGSGPKTASAAPQLNSSAPRARRPGSHRHAPGGAAGRPIHTPKTAIKPREPQEYQAPRGDADSRQEDILRLVPLGGLEEIGRNCSFFEYKNEIVIVDAGLQFPEEETPGIDYIIPNVTYLQNKKSNVQAIILTHGHYDHIGALPYILDKLGNPPI